MAYFDETKVSRAALEAVRDALHLLKQQKHGKVSWEALVAMLYEDVKRELAKRDQRAADVRKGKRLSREHAAGRFVADKAKR